MKIYGWEQGANAVADDQQTERKPDKRIESSDHQIELYHTLNVLMKEQSEERFRSEMGAFIKLWLPHQPEFIKYFNASRPGEHAYCKCNHNHQANVYNVHNVIYPVCSMCTSLALPPLRKGERVW